VKENNTKVAARMVKKKGGQVIQFKKGDIALLAIPGKHRQTTEPDKLPCRVLKKVNKVC
jgi:hypothetical protein